MSTKRVVQDSSMRVRVERIEVMAIPLPTEIPLWVIIMIWAGPPPLSKGVTAQTNRLTQTNCKPNQVLKLALAPQVRIRNRTRSNHHIKITAISRRERGSTLISRRLCHVTDEEEIYRIIHAAATLMEIKAMIPLFVMIGLCLTRLFSP